MPAVGGGIAGVVAGGSVAVLGGAGLVVAGLVAAASPRRCGGSCTGSESAAHDRAARPRQLLRAGSKPPTPRPADVCSDPRSLSDDELCRAWRYSYAATRQTAAPDRQAHLPHLPHLVDLRRVYLDESERLYPAGFARWMAAGARAASDPARYLTPASDPPAQQDR